MNISEKGIEFIAKFEGNYLEAYKCPAGIITIGIGCTYYENNEPIKLGDIIAKERSFELFRNIVTRYEKIVNSHLRFPVKQNQFDALVSHAFNCGYSETLYKLVNDRDNELYSWWCNHYVLGGGKKLPGLVKRRKAEADLYFS